MRVRAAIGLAVLATLVPASAAHAVTAQQAIDALNSQRASNGIPAGIVENPDWSRGCAQHNAYLKAHPAQWNSDPHDEYESEQGYTRSGQQAARSSVLTTSNGYAESAGANPWENAPIHLMQLLGPELSVTGYADTPGACMWTWPGYQRPGPEQPVVYTYPGDGASIYASMTSNESPFAPVEFVGLSQSTPTGPHLYVLVHGLDNQAARGHITAAGLTGPQGPEEVRTVDNATESSRGSLGDLLPPGGIVIPVKPLKPASLYTAAVTFQTNGGATLNRTWSFRTQVPRQVVSLQARKVRPGRPFVIRYIAPSAGRMTVSLRRGGRTYGRGTLATEAGNGYVTMSTRQPGAYTIKATLKTTVTTRFTARVRVLRR